MSATHVPWLLTTGGCSCELCCRPPEPAQVADAERAIFLREDAAAIVQELASLHTGGAFLYVHFYSGDVSTEPLPILARTRRAPESLSSRTEPIHRDELIEITSRKQRKPA